MKRTILPLMLVFALILGLASCNNSGDTGNILGNNNTVNFTMGAQQSQSGNTQFTWQPSVDVKITQLILGTTNFGDTIVDNSGQTYTANQSWVYPQEYSGVTSGQQWQFIFTGTTPSNNQTFTSTINYTIP